MSLGLPLALLAKGDKYPTAPPEFQLYVGWLMFGLLILVALYTWLRADSVRRAVLALDDPRVFAVLRIGFAIMTIINFVNLQPYWRMLWSDEGLFDLQYAQEKLGRAALRGWDPEEGFYDRWAVICFLWNKPSLLYFWGSPDFIVGYMTVFFIICGLYGAGVLSRTTGILAWFLMSGIYNRNALYWEGTDTVYRAFWFILLFAKTGHAWSFDNWWRCRRLKAKGRLEDPDKSDEDNLGKEPIYRLVPSWTRYLFMLQLAALYLTTGAVKTGSVWAVGDALYYALNMDHFYRFEWHTQQLSAVFGTNVFRLMTWVTHWWEQLFPFVLVGVVLRFTQRHRDQPWYRAQDTKVRKWGARLVLLAIWGLVWRINYLVLPFCLAMVKDTPQPPQPAWDKINIAYGVVIPTFVVLWYVLGRWEPVLLRGGRDIPKVTARFGRIRIPEIRFTQEGLRGWLLGRRVWLTLGFMFHGFLIAFMNIGMFPFIMLMTYAAFLSGDEWRRILYGIVTWVAGRRRLSRIVPKGYERWFIEAQSPRKVPVRGRNVPWLGLLVLGTWGLSLAYLYAKEPEWLPEWVGEDLKMWTFIWLGTCLAIATVCRFLPPRNSDLARTREPGPALAYTPPGRFLAFFAVVYHASAVGISLFPSYPLFSKWRAKTRTVLYASDWLKGTGTSQSWRMFAPNPPRANTFLKTVVVEEDGERWDLRNNSFHYRPNPWIINDRMRKMQRRMAGKGKWYLRYWASFHCREWELAGHDPPKQIEISKIITRIPTPDMVKEKGPYHPRKLRSTEVDIQTHKCSRDGRLPLSMKERYGFEITEADLEKARKEAEAYDRKFSKRKENWDKRKDFGRWWEAEREQEQRRAKAQLRRDAREARIQRARQDHEGGSGGGLDDEGAPDEELPPPM